MSPAKSTPTEDEWERHKAAIRRLYLVQEVPQKRLLEAVKQLGLDVTYVCIAISYTSSGLLVLD